MPTVTVPSASDRAHSWLSVYFRLAGIDINAPDIQGIDEERPATRVRPFRTNGYFTVLAGSHLSRIFTFAASPACTPFGNRASAIEMSSVGEKLPLVISPRPLRVSTSWCARR